LPGVLVPLAYTLHIFSLRRIFLMRKGKSAEKKDAGQRMAREQNPEMISA
jgi:hypothetical protein